jgi:hypothetical protein
MTCFARSVAHAAGHSFTRSPATNREPFHLLMLAIGVPQRRDVGVGQALIDDSLLLGELLPVETIPIPPSVENIRRFKA